MRRSLARRPAKNADFKLSMAIRAVSRRGSVGTALETARVSEGRRRSGRVQIVHGVKDARIEGFDEGDNIARIPYA